MLDPTTLRVMADAYDKKAQRYEPESEDFNHCIDQAIDLRLRANAIEDERTRR